MVGCLKKLWMMGPMLISVALNQLDFWSDILVVLSYGCFLPNSLEPACPTTSSWEPADINATTNGTVEVEPGAELTCLPHPWWFGLGSALLVVATVVPACKWVGEAEPEGRCSAVGLFLLACLQLNDFLDLKEAWCSEEEKLPEDLVKRRGLKDIFAKACESVPQGYLQGYVLYRLGAHGQPLKVSSFAISCASLGHGVMVLAARRADDPAELGPVRFKVLVFLFFSSDLAVMTGALAMAMVEPVRPWAVVILALGLTVPVSLAINESIERVICFCVLNHLLPVGACAPPKEYKEDKSSWRLGVRYLQSISLAVLALCFTRTACGGAPTSEALIFAGLLAANIGFLVLLRLVINKSCCGFPQLPGFRNGGEGTVLGQSMDRE